MLRVVPVASDLMVRATFGTAAPVPSVTVPRMLPVAVCDHAGRVKHKLAATKNTKKASRRELLNMRSPVLENNRPAKPLRPSEEPCLRRNLPDDTNAAANPSVAAAQLNMSDVTNRSRKEGNTL